MAMDSTSLTWLANAINWQYQSEDVSSWYVQKRSEKRPAPSDMASSDSASSSSGEDVADHVAVDSPNEKDDDNVEVGSVAPTVSTTHVVKPPLPPSGSRPAVGQKQTHLIAFFNKRVRAGEL